VFEVIARRSDGDLFPAYVAAAGIATQDGRRGATLYMCRDISESKRFQDMMIRLDRYYTRGQMAGDIAHEINNYLAVLMGNLELLPLLLKKGNSEKVDKKLTVMIDTVDKIARFANGLMDVPQEEVRLEQSSLNQIVENVVAFLKPQNRFDTVDITTNLSTDIPLLLLDQGQIQQLLVNLIYNASDAVSGKEKNERRIVISTLVSRDSDGEWACVEVRDNGPGVVPEREEALFKERFTTKRKGHGIGLITCRKIVENHRGSVRYRSDSGSVFTACFPTRPALSKTTETEAVGETQRA
jgi:C4-dicarboxylate-specific signal transduction histidine kinase